MIKYIKTKEEYDKTITSGNYLVDFYANWCGPCKMLEPNLEALADTVEILKVDIDALPEIATSYGVMSIPTLIFLSNGNIKNKSIGYITKEEIENLIK